MVISSAAVMSLRSIAFSETILAYSPALAVEGTSAVSVAIYALPPTISRVFLLLSSSHTVSISTAVFSL